jgi:hypothetical protein
MGDDDGNMKRKAEKVNGDASRKRSKVSPKWLVMIGDFDIGSESRQKLRGYTIIYMNCLS